MEAFHIISFSLLFISQSHAKLYVSDYPGGYAFDRELHESVLDSELCRQQLNHILFNDTALLLQFFDAGPRIPKGILTGNLKSLGNFYQCLKISRSMDDTRTIEGKYCTINVGLKQNANTISLPQIDWLPERTKEWQIFAQTLLLDDQRILKDLEQKHSSLRDYLVFGPDLKGSTRNNRDSRLGDAGALTGLQFTLGICIPKACTVDEAVNSILNISSVIQINKDLCRLPNDKNWVTADYVAIAIFSILGFIILVSTCYDVHHIFYLKKNPKQMHPLRIFSAYSNMAILLDTPDKPGKLECLDGVRAMAMLWVLLGHTYYIIPPVGANLLDLLEWQENVKGIWITGALHTVDTFFMLSGLLLVYISVAKFKNGVALLKNLHIFYLNRLVRMFPILATVVLFEASLYNRISDGPFWDLAGTNVHRCRAFWWSTLLYVQNFVNPQEACLGVTWYLAIDMQLHIISPLVLYWMLGTGKRSSWSALTFGMIVSLTITICYIFCADITDYYTYYYVNVLTRSPPFFVGMIVGYFLRVYRNKEFKMSAILSAIVTIIAIGLTSVVLYLNFLKSLSDWDHEVFGNLIDSFTRSVWCASLGWIIFVCVNGYGGPINYILSMGIWKIPSRISYGMYLVHFSLMVAYYASAVEPVYFSIGSGLFRFCGFLFITIVLAILITALIDMPVSAIFKIIVEGGGKKPPTKPQEQIIPHNEIDEKHININGTSNDGFVPDDAEKAKPENSKF
ncbi:nose resistant to fluoxetine protein 6-like [Colias croceus]|uniref:nose resistant to fluoxetine protein 6-like n=1 Tax=Colias crocea TaxID=72248 RepID=UPI001E279D92|nr:nose resistant to fluoxetine protein 6-like [Colias croceus]